MLLSSVTLGVSSVSVSADSSDVTDCSTSFSGTISEPFNAETKITINSLAGDYEIEFDYAVAIGDEGPSYFLKSFALQPSAVTFVEGETISTILTSGETIVDGVMKLYHQDISDCDILFNSSNIPENKRIVLSAVNITEIEPFKFLVQVPIPDSESAKDFTKLVIAYVSNLEASVSYNIRNVTIISALDSGPLVFCGKGIEDFDEVINGTANSDLINGTGSDDLIRGYGGDDTIDGKGGNDCISGNGGDDTLLGGPGDDGIYGGTGDDEISGNGGDDTLYGNEGDDLISGGDGDDYIAGKTGNDSVFGNNGNDKLFGNEGDDFLKGGDGDDIMFGGKGHDVLLGNTGADRLSGQEDADALIGGRGDDRLRGGEGNDEHDGGKGRDTCYDDSANFDASPPIHCEENVLVSTDTCTGKDINFVDIRQIPPFVAKNSLTLDSFLGTFEVALDYYIVEDGDIKTYLRDFESQDSDVEVKLSEGRLLSFDIGSTSPDVVIAMLVEESISDCDIVADLFGIPEDKKAVMSVLDVAPRLDFDYEVLAEIPDASNVNKSFTKLVIFYTESPETAAVYIVPNVEIVAADHIRPEITISQPVNGTQFIRDSVPEISFLVTGTAFDSMSGINRVEVALKDPYTLQTIREYEIATPINQDDWSTWSYGLTLENEGDYLITARATDSEGNMNWSKAFVSNILVANISIAPNASIPGNPSFVPRLMIVGVGDTVTWTNNDFMSHIVTSGDPRIAEPNGKFKSGLLEPNAVFSHTFTDAGSYQYFCAIHPFMIGEVWVQ